MLQPEHVREIVARLARGEKIKALARELGVDRKTIRRWRRLGGWQPRRLGRRASVLEAFVPFIERRGLEVGWNVSRVTPAEAAVSPPQWDPAYRPVGDVMVHPLSLYAAVAEAGGAP